MGRIGVGIIGVAPERGWAAMAHIPALRALDRFELVAVATTRRSSAAAAARVFGVPNAFDNHQALIACPAVDLVVVTVKTPHHHELVMGALAAGKPVYCEWPLGNGLAEAEAMRALADDRGVATVIGLQARFAPAIRHVRDLVRDGWIGDVLSTTLVGSGFAWGAVMDQANAYCGDRRNGATLLSIPLGHTVDALCTCLGEFSDIAADMIQVRDRFTVAETGESMPMTAPDQVLVSARLASGAGASIHYRGGMTQGTNLLWEINGTKGVLRITADSGHAQLADLHLRGARDGTNGLQDIAVPRDPAEPDLPGPAGNVGRIYARIARNWESGRLGVPGFADAVVRHRMLDAIERAAETGQRQRL